MTPARRTNEEVLNGDVLTCTVPEAMQILGIGLKAVFELCDEGSLSFFYAGRNRKIGVPSLKRLIGAAPSPAN